MTITCEPPGRQRLLPAAAAPPGAPATRLRVLVSTLASDCHTWNLIFLQRLIEQYGHLVTNLGPCVDERMLVDEALACRPDLIVVSSVNGHGMQDAPEAVRALREAPDLERTIVVIGGKLTLDDDLSGPDVSRLRRAGFDAVFTGSATSGFEQFLAGVAQLARARRCTA